MRNPSQPMHAAFDSVRHSQSYLTEYTFGSLWTAIARIYRSHFLLISMCNLLPILPLIALQAYAQAFEPGLVIWIFAAIFLVGVVVNGAYTGLLSDICVGNQPTIRRSFAYILQQWRWAWLLSTAVIYILGIMVGMVLLVIPGYIVIFRGIFSPAIVALEGRRNLDAIKRSFALTKGQAWRVFGLLLPSYLLLYVPSFLAGFYAGRLTGWEQALNYFIAASIISGVFAPAFSITIVLLYYDQRVRREAYDAHRLSEDLMR